ncbi:MAG TPA: prolyl oligopeptidase family serine peptidase [Caulobacteraceae bacterium]
MIRTICSIAAIGMLVASAAGAQTGDTVAIYTPARPFTETIQGVGVVDPYRWLEDANDPLVVNWTQAENQRTRDRLDALKTRDPIKRDLTRLITATAPAYSDLQARGAHVFGLYSDPARQQSALVILSDLADPASRKALIDPNILDPSGLTAIDWYVASPDGRLVAVSLSKGGSEDGTLHIYDVASGQEIGQPIPRVQYPTAGGSLAWAQDSRGFWYTRYPSEDAPVTERHFNLQLYFHALAAEPAQPPGAGRIHLFGHHATAAAAAPLTPGDWRVDPLALGAKDGLERVSEIFLDNRYGRGVIMASVQRGDGGEWAHYLLRRGKPPALISTYADKIVYATVGPDDAVYGVSRAGAPNGKIVKLKLKGLKLGATLANAPVIVPESNVAILTDGAAYNRPDLTLDHGHLIVRDIVGGPNQLRVFNLEGKPLFKLPLPEIAANSEIEVLADGDMLFDVSTYLRARYYQRWTPTTGKVVEAGLGGQSPIDFSDAEVVRAFATSKDGTKVPLNIVRRRGLALNGQTPTLLYGYGGYGLSMSPSFLGAMRRLWLDSGGVYVVANIRGGSEYGERWHSQGALTNKQNVFDDFAAAGQFLIDSGYTSHDKLAIMGGSNGGLLMGATLTQHPSLAHAVVSSVGIYDMLRVELDPNGAFNVTEFGSIKDPDQFKALYAYSPYHHARMGTAYPAVLMLTGANDGRVNPMQSRKFTAVLQADSSSGLPILLRTSTTSGHGIGSSLTERIGQQTDQLAFLFDQLGMDYPPGTTLPTAYVAPPWQRPAVHGHVRHRAKPKPAAKPN